MSKQNGFSKKFSFMGVDIDINMAKNEKQEKEEVKMEQKAEEKKVTNDKKSTGKSSDLSNLDIAVGILGGIGGFAIAKGVVKTFIQTRNPIVALGVGAVEVYAALYSCSKLAYCSNAFGKSVKKHVKELKKEVKEGYNDTVTFKD